MSKELSQKAKKGFQWGTMATGTQAGVAFLTLIPLVSILGPVEYGKMALLQILISVSAAIGQMGMSQAIIQHPNLKKVDNDTAFCINMGLGAVLAVSLLFGSGAIADLLGSADLKELIALSAVVFVASPIAYIFRANLQKTLEFDVLAKTTIGLAFVSSLVKLSYAFFGFGAASLVYGTITVVMLEIVIFTVYFKRKKSWFPTFQFSKRSAHELLGFGVFVSLKSILNQVGKDIDSIIISRVLGLEAVGIYNIAKQIMQRVTGMVGNIVNSVSFPYFSALRAAEGSVDQNSKSVSLIYLKMLKVLAMIGVPVGVCLAALPTNAVSNSLSETWSQSGIVFQIFALKAVLDVVSGGLSSSVLYSCGRAKFLFFVDLMVTPIRVGLYLTAALIWGIEGIAWMFLFSVIIKVTIIQRELNKVLSIRWKEYVPALKAGLVPALAGLATTGALDFFLMSGFSPPLRIVACTMAFLTAAIGCSISELRYLAKNKRLVQ